MTPLPNCAQLIGTAETAQTGVAAAPHWDAPLVSIVTPVYNAARWLPQTLATVQAQTWTDWEHILVDDGSKDGSQSILEASALADSRRRPLYLRSNQGPSAARNRALETARGRYVAFLDADDLWHPEKLARSMQWMHEHHFAFIYHDYRHLSHDGLRVGRRIAGPEELNLRTLHTRRGTGGCLSVVLDREQVGDLRFPPLSHHYKAEDFCLWLSLIQQGHVGHRLPADLGRYRLTPRSRSSNKIGCAVDVWRLYRRFSHLPVPVAALWWIQYAWNTFWLYRSARPRVPA
jgi:glycosyltransferase involved in cell wall biosynthesis